MLVILRHCGQGFFKSEGLFFEVWTQLLSPVAVPIYFMISAFLFFWKDVSSRKLRKQVYRIFRLYVVWTLLYLPLNVLQSKTFDFIDYFQNLLFSGSYYHLWFLPALIVALLIVYFMKSNRAGFVIGMGLFVIGVICESYEYILPARILEIEKFYKNIFLTFRNGVFFGSVYCMIGKILAQKELKITNTLVKILFLAGIMGTGAEFLINRKLAPTSVVNMYFSSIPLGTAILIVLLKGSFNISSNMALCFRRMSTIVFCIHPWVMAAVRQVRLEAFSSAMMTVFLSLLSAVAIVVLQKKISWFKYLY